MNNWTRFKKINFNVKLLIISILTISSINMIKASRLFSEDEKYSEKMIITYLPNYSILSEINFDHSKKISKSFDTNDDSVINLGSFPKFIYNLPTKFGVTEGKISFTRGLWDYEKWSQPPSNDMTSSGFQFHGYFDNNFDISKSFDDMISYISGYLCSSLTSLKYSNALKPYNVHPFEIKSPLVSNNLNDFSLLIGILPHEPICNENLLAWLNLLPFGDEIGIASAINPAVIYRNEFHSMHIDFFINCIQYGEDQNCSEKSLHMSLRLFTVFDLSRWNRNLRWDILGLFGNEIEPSGDSFKLDSKIILRIPNGNNFTSSLLYQQQKSENVSAEINNNLRIEYSGSDLLERIGCFDMPLFKNPIDPAIQFQSYRYKSGSTDDFGGFGLVLDNQSDQVADVLVLECIPWLFKLFLHDSEVSINGVKSSLDYLLQEYSVILSISRKRDYYIQSKWRIPAQSKVQFFIPFEREFLHIEEFPADSERGIELPGAIVSIKFVPDDNYDGYKKYDFFSLTTNALLFTWPIPDNTMPYNTITYSASIIGLFFGAFFNIIYRRYYLKHPSDPPIGIVPRLIWNIKNGIRNKFKRKCE